MDCGRQAEPSRKMMVILPSGLCCDKLVEV